MSWRRSLHSEQSHDRRLREHGEKNSDGMEMSDTVKNFCEGRIVELEFFSLTVSGQGL